MYDESSGGSTGSCFKSVYNASLVFHNTLAVLNNILLYIMLKWSVLVQYMIYDSM